MKENSRIIIRFRVERDLQTTITNIMTTLFGWTSEWQYIRTPVQEIFMIGRIQPFYIRSPLSGVTILNSEVNEKRAEMVVETLNAFGIEAHR